MVLRQWARIFLNYLLCSKRRRAVSLISVWSHGSALGFCFPRFKEVLHVAVATESLAVLFFMNIGLWNPHELKKHYLTCTDGVAMRMFPYGAQVAQQRSQAEYLSQPGQNVEVIAFRAVLSEHNPKSKGFPHSYNYSHSTHRNFSLEISLCVLQSILLKVRQEWRNFKLHYYPYSWKNNCKGRRYLQCLDVTLTLTWVCCQDDSRPTTELKRSHEQLWAIFLWREWCWFYTVNNYEKIITSSPDQRQA